MEKYKKLVKQILKTRFKKGVGNFNILEIRFVNEGIRVDYSYEWNEIGNIQGELIYNSELNAYIYENIN